MNDIIAEYYSQKVEALEWTDVVGGLVKTVSKRVLIGDNKYKTQYFPVACDTTWEDCEGNSESLRMLVPDSSKRCVIYFEDKGTSQRMVDGKVTMVSNLRLVCWMNLNRFNNAGCSLSFYAISSLQNALFTSKPENFSSIVQSIRCTSWAVAPKSADIFSKYTYNEFKQFLLKPFDYFAIDIVTEFSVNPSCVPDLSPKEDDCN